MRQLVRACPAIARVVALLVVAVCGVLWFQNRAWAVVYPATAAIAVLALSWTWRNLDRLQATSQLEAGRLGDLQALVEASSLLQAETSNGAVPGLIARLATAVLKGSQASVLLIDAEGRLVPASEPSSDRLRVDESVAADVVRDGRVVTLTEAKRTLLCVPLMGTMGGRGLVVVSGPKGAEWFDAFRLQLARLFGSHAGMAIERLHVIENLTQATMRDPLTGVGNRRHAWHLLESLGPQDAVLLIDLDHFKHVNDTDGHVAGDIVLVTLGRFLRDALRSDDLVARYGGEEFLVVLRGAGANGRLAADRLCASWRSTQPRTTFSVGVAVHNGDAGPRATFSRADAALYRAKRAGRDRTCEFAAETDVAADAEGVFPGAEVSTIRQAVSFERAG